jgi:N-acetyl-alpha-D-glucosaminyl L-malate synthase BshA
LNIGIICYPTVGGSGVIATELGKAMAEAGHQIHFISYDKPFRLNKKSNNIFFHKVAISNYPLFKYPPFEFNLASKIAEIAVVNKLDILHIHYAVPFTMCAYIAKQMVKEIQDFKIISTLHGTDVTIVGQNSSTKDLMSFILNQSDMVTAVSNSLANEASEIFNINKQIQTIYNFIDVSEYTPINFDINYRNLFAHQHEKIIIHVSNLRPVKRPIDVLESYMLIKQKLPSKLIIIGDGPEKQELSKYITTYNLENDVVFLNKEFLNKEIDIPKLLAVSDLFLLTSEKESFGLAVLEAMSSGLPVVSTNTGGLPELIANGETGFLAAVGDIEQLVAYSLQILCNDELSNRLSKNARNRATTYFNKQYIVAQYEKMFLNLLK